MYFENVIFLNYMLRIRIKEGYDEKNTVHIFGITAFSLFAVGKLFCFYL